MQEQYLSNCFASGWKSVRNIGEIHTTTNNYVFFIKVDQIFDSNFSKDAWNRKTQGLLVEYYIKYLKVGYGSDCITSWSKFSKNIGNQKSDYAILAIYKNWLKFCERAKWNKLYVLSFASFCHSTVLENQINSEI